MSQISVTSVSRMKIRTTKKLKFFTLWYPSLDTVILVHSSPQNFISR